MSDPYNSRGASVPPISSHVSATLVRRFWLLAAWLLLVPGFAAATNTLCDFIGSDQFEQYSLEFIGSGEISMIQVNSPRFMRMTNYEVRDFDYRERRIDLVHAGSDEQGILPAFTLKGRADSVLLSINGREITGTLKCQWQNDQE